MKYVWYKLYEFHMKYEFSFSSKNDNRFTSCLVGNFLLLQYQI